MRQSESDEKSNRKTRMYLLYGNREIDDVIDSSALREYERSSGGMLEIIYVFSVPPPNESNELSYLQGSITSDIVQKWFSDIKAKNTAGQQSTLDFSPTFQPYPPYQYQYQFPQKGEPSGITHTPPTSSFPKYGSARNTKIVVCGPPEMMLSAKQTLTDLGYSEMEYILLI